MKKILALLLALAMAMLCAVSVSFGETAGFSAGDIITFGRYPQTAEGTDETPIEWIVLEVDEENHKALLLSKYGLDAVPYNKEYTDTTWETCSLRAWLNQDFLSKAFSPEEQATILLTNVDNSDAQGYSKWKTSGGGDTQDYVFLLSYAEANRYLEVANGNSNNNRSRVAPTAYAISQGAGADDIKQTSDGEPTGWWWLRSPGNTQDFVLFVHNDGSLNNRNAISGTGVVRPALWADLNASAFKTGNQQADAEPFTFRNGITWGMSKEEVIAQEGDVYDKSEVSGNVILDYSNVKFSKYSAYLTYVILDEKLVACCYSLPDSEQEAFDYLLKVYDSKYGDHQETDHQELFGFIRRINKDFTPPENMQDYSICRWEAADGTGIWMVWGDVTDNVLAVYYVSPAFLNPPEEELNMTGV